MKILVTGATGRIGANLAGPLLSDGHEIRSFVYPGDAGRAHKLKGWERVETVTGDLRNLQDVRQAVEGVDAVVHLAAAFAGPFDHREYLDINAMGTLNILECIRADRPDLHRLVYACTEAIYWDINENGRYFTEPVTEEMVSRHHAMPYFLTKWMGEELCMAYHHQYGVPATVMRFATVIEPSEFLNQDGLPPMFLFSPVYRRYQDWQSDDPSEQEMFAHIRALWHEEEKFLLSRNPNGTPYKQHFADVRDIVQGLVLGLEKEAAVGEAFTLGGAALFKWEEIVPALAARFNVGVVEARLPYQNYFEFDLSKIEDCLGFRPQYDFHHILETAEAIRRGEETDVIPAGVSYETTA